MQDFYQLQQILEGKRQLFRSQQRQKILDKIFKDKRKSCRSPSDIQATLLKSEYDTQEYQHCIDFILQESMKEDVCQYFENLTSNLFDLIELQIDQGYHINAIKILIIYSNQLEMYSCCQLLELIDQYGVCKLLEFRDITMLQFLELYLMKHRPINFCELNTIFQSLIPWLQDWNFECVILAAHCLYYVFKHNSELLSEDIVMSTLSLLQTEFSSIAIKIISLAQWEYFQECNLYTIWDQIGKSLVNNPDDICSGILLGISRFIIPMEFQDICTYLKDHHLNDQNILHLLTILAEQRFDNYNSISQTIIDLVFQRLLIDDNKEIKILVKQFITNNVIRLSIIVTINLAT